MLFLLLGTASALAASKDIGDIDYGTAPLHLDHLDGLDEHQDDEPLEDFAAGLGDPRHDAAVRDKMLSMHQQVLDQLDVPAVPDGADKEARLRAVLHAFHQHPPTTSDEDVPPPKDMRPSENHGYPKALRPKDSSQPDGLARGPTDPEEEEEEAPADDAPKDSALADRADDIDVKALAEAMKKDVEAAKLQSVVEPSGLAGHEAEALAKIGKSLKAMVMMHVLMQPMLQKLKAVATHMEGPAKDAAAATLQHLSALDLYSEKAADMLTVIQKAAKGSPDEQDKAIKLLEVGLLMVKAGMHKHMMALKKLKQQAVAAQPEEPKGITGKLRAVVQEMQIKVDAELADPKRKGDPLVGLDVQMLEAMKKAVAHSEALVDAAKVEMQKHPEKAKQYKDALKLALHKVSGDLKGEMKALKEKAMVLVMVAKALKEKEDAQKAGKPAEEAPADAPSPDEAAETPPGESLEPKVTFQDPAEAKAPAGDAEAPAEAEAPESEGEAPAEAPAGEAPAEAKAPANEAETPAGEAEGEAPADAATPEEPAEAAAPADADAPADPAADAPADPAAEAPKTEETKSKALSAVKGLLNMFGVSLAHLRSEQGVNA